MDVISIAAVMVGIVAGVIGAVAGTVQVVEYFAKRRNRTAIATPPEEHAPRLEQPAIDAGTEPRKRHNLPAQLTSLIGRTREIELIETWLRNDQARLLTLTGPGGIGKTRLALQVAWDLLDSFENGVYFVSLASIGDGSLVLPSIAQVLGAKETSGLPVLDGLTEHLRDTQLLLVLDNFEHVIDAAPQVAELLAQCPRLKVLATSREVLRIRGEHEILLSPLSVPDQEHLASTDGLLGFDAFALFVERAQAANPSFAVTANNARSIAEICRRLDGLPLAIELAAAWTRVLSPSVILAQLEQKLLISTAGMRDAPQRQQSLEATIAWSYNMLSRYEQTLFAQLSVFVGGFTLEAAQSVARLDGGNEGILNGIASLVGKNLLQRMEQADGASRFHMLETIREYGYRYLRESEDFEGTVRNHVEFYLALAEQARPHLESEQIGWLNTLEQEIGNLRFALDWLVAHKEVEMGLRLASALGLFWAVRGYWAEGRDRLEKLLMASDCADKSSRAKALQAAGQILGGLGEYARADELYEESLKLSLEVGDTRTTARTLLYSSLFYTHQGDYERAGARAEEAQRLFQQLGNQSGIAESLNLRGVVFLYQGRIPEAAALCEDSRQRFSALDDKRGVALSVETLGNVRKYEGDYVGARSLYFASLSAYREMSNRQREAVIVANLGEIALAEGCNADAKALCDSSLAIFQGLEDKRGMARVYMLLGSIAFAEGTYQEAEDLYQRSLSIMQALRDKRYVAKATSELGRVRVAQGRIEEGIELLAMGYSILTRIGSVQTANDRRNCERSLDLARSKLSPEQFKMAWDRGQQVTTENALELDWALT